MVMLLGNKAVLNAFPYPLTLTCAQLVFATLVTFPPLLVRGFTTMTKQQTSLFVLEGVLFFCFYLRKPEVFEFNKRRDCCHRPQLFTDSRLRDGANSRK